MEGRVPPDDDDLFEWTDAPARPPRRARERPGTGDRERVGRRSDTEERRRVRGDTGEFERSGRRPPPGRRARRRDLPARVRRRQDFIVGGLALAVVIGLIVLISSGGGGTSGQPVPLKRLLGQTVVAKVTSKGPDQALLRRVRKGQVGGVIVFETDAQKLKGDVQQLQSAASAGKNPPLLVMIDQEGGTVKRIKNGPP